MLPTSLFRCFQQQLSSTATAQALSQAETGQASIDFFSFKVACERRVHQQHRQFSFSKSCKKAWNRANNSCIFLYSILQLLESCLQVSENYNDNRFWSVLWIFLKRWREQRARARWNWPLLLHDRAKWDLLTAICGPTGDKYGDLCY